MTKKIVLFVFVSVNLTVSAQFDSHFNQWSGNLQQVNSAVTGLNPKMEIKSNYRMQWVGFDGAPRQSRVTVAVPLRKENKLYELTRQGVGCSIENDQVAAFSVNKIQVQYGIHFRLKHKLRLSFGLGAGAFQLGYNPDKVETYYPDPSVKRQVNAIKPLVNFGGVVSGERFLAGVSVHHFIPLKWDDVGVNSNYSTQIALLGIYAVKINNLYELIPSVLLSKTLNAPMLMETNLKLNYFDRIFSFVGFRVSRSIYLGGEIGLTKKWFASYSFEYGLTGVKNVTFSSHEIGLAFRMNNGVIEPGYKHRTNY